MSHIPYISANRHNNSPRNLFARYFHFNAILLHYHRTSSGIWNSQSGSRDLLPRECRLTFPEQVLWWRRYERQRVQRNTEKDGKVKAKDLQATCICLLSSTDPPGKRGLSARQTRSLPSSSTVTLNVRMLPVKESVSSSLKTTILLE